MKIIKEKSKKAINEITKAIEKGNVVILSTDTVYGLIADATSEKTVKKVFEIKKRQTSKAIPIFVKDIKMAKKIAKIDKNQERFLKKFWPGKITVIFKKKENCNLPKIIYGDKNTIGIRIPDHKLLNILLNKLKKPLTGTSANISGKKESININEVLKQFKNQKMKPDLIIDAGILKSSKPSTILDLSRKKVKISRIGAISEKEILKFLK